MKNLTIALMKNCQVWISLLMLTTTACFSEPPVTHEDAENTKAASMDRELIGSLPSSFHSSPLSDSDTTLRLNSLQNFDESLHPKRFSEIFKDFMVQQKDTNIRTSKLLVKNNLDTEDKTKVSKIDLKSGNTPLHNRHKSTSLTEPNVRESGEPDMRRHLMTENKNGKMPWETTKDSALALDFFCRIISTAPEENLKWIVDKNEKSKNPYSVIKKIQASNKLSTGDKKRITKKVISKLSEEEQKIYWQLDKLQNHQHEVWTEENSCHTWTDENNDYLKRLIFKLLANKSWHCFTKEQQLANLTLQEAIIQHPLAEPTILNLLKENQVSFTELVQEKHIYKTIAKCGSLTTLLWLFENEQLPNNLSPYKVIICIEQNSKINQLEVSNLAQILVHTGTFCKELEMELSEILQHESKSLSCERKKKWEAHL